jgi:FAD/FMN-containing dehydrogenase
MTSTATGCAGLRRLVEGQVLLPGDPGYDKARQVWNAAVDRYPAAILRPASVADVQAAVRFAAEHGVPVSVRGSGHHHAGYAAGDGALMVDFSGCRDVALDPAAGTVRVQPGVTWARLDQAAQQAGLATTGADVPMVAVAGTTLGGGFGWLHRRFGLSCDNLLAAQLVTATGELETVDDKENPELLWALRGAGGAFGVVSSLTLALHPVPPVHTATALVPLDQARGGLAAYRELTASAPDELFARAMLMPAPQAPFVPEPLRGRPVLMLAAAWIGDPAGAEAGLRPLQALGGPPAQPITYLGLQRLSEQGFPGRVRASARGHFLDGLSDGLIDVLIGAAGDAPAMSMIQLQPGGGAMARVGPGATAFPYRTATHHLHLQGLTPPGESGSQHAEWVQAWDTQIRPHATGGIYANAATPGDDTDLAMAAYGSNLARLTALKTRLDPAGLFRFTPLTAPPPADRLGTPAPAPGAGWRVLGFGRQPEVAAAIQARLRSLGYQATNFALTDDADGDARLVGELQQAHYDGVAIGGFINGQDPSQPPTEETMLWFNRVLNLIHVHAPTAKIILVRNPPDAVPALHRVLGANP